jgi:hypothetical protein
LIGGGGDESDGQPHCVAAADIQITNKNCYLELGEVEAGSDRWRRRWK